MSYQRHPVKESTIPWAIPGRRTKQPKLPPYGKQLLARRKSRELLPGDVIIFMGSEAWREAKDPRQQFCKAPLVFPADTSPEVFAWPIQGRPVLVFQYGDINELKVLQLANVLLQQGASVVRFLGDDGLTVFGSGA